MKDLKTVYTGARTCNGQEELKDGTVITGAFHQINRSQDKDVVSDKYRRDQSTGDY